MNLDRVLLLDSLLNNEEFVVQLGANSSRWPTAAGFLAFLGEVIDTSVDIDASRDNGRLNGRQTFEKLVRVTEQEPVDRSYLGIPSDLDRSAFLGEVFKSYVV